MRVHQLHAGFIPGDAVCNSMQEIDVWLHAWGFESYIYAHYIAPELLDQAQSDKVYATYIDEHDDLLIYHYGLYTPTVRYFQMTRNRRILVYHNITPAIYYQGWDDEQASLCHLGRQALKSLQCCDLALGDSDFNRCELVKVGFPKEKTDVLPLSLPRSRFDDWPVDRQLLESLRVKGRVNFLTVGRIVPSKAIDDVIRIFYVYQRTINPHSRLHIVGSRYMPLYNDALDHLIAEMGLGDAIVFTGLVSDAALKAYYQSADLYITASYHEGFCIPLLESMYFGVPILARKAAAIPETLGKAGVLFTDLGYEKVAEMAHLMVTNQGLRQHIVRSQKERFEEFSPAHSKSALRRALERIGLAVNPCSAPG